MNRIYICGPMTGLPEFNYPAFNSAAEVLRGMGAAVENPAENPEPECKSWSGYMRLSLAQLVKCNVLVVLPGWFWSRGARVEIFVAFILGLKIQHIRDFAE